MYGDMPPILVFTISLFASLGILVVGWVAWLFSKVSHEEIPMCYCPHCGDEHVHFEKFKEVMEDGKEKKD